MVKRTGPQTLELLKLIKALRSLSIKENVKLWKRIAEDLERSTRIRRVINLYKIDKFAKDNEIIIVPGKVLGVGELSKKVKVAAYQFSSSAQDKIKDKLMSIEDLMKENPKGQKVRILG
jgi:large subunit ribosomal protein L18e